MTVVPMLLILVAGLVCAVFAVRKSSGAMRLMLLLLCCSIALFLVWMAFMVFSVGPAMRGM